MHDNVNPGGVSVQLHQEFVDGSRMRERRRVVVGLAAILGVLGFRWLIGPGSRREAPMLFRHVQHVDWQDVEIALERR